MRELDAPVDGSSPLARGKCYAAALAAVKLGFIPTRAGKIEGVLKSVANSAVHPHSRGENAQHDTGAGSHRGSSPLARGK